MTSSSHEVERASATELAVDWAGIDVDAMDCAADNLAVLLRFHGATDVLAPFGSEWHLGLGPTGELVTERTPVEQLVAAHCGFAVRHEVVAPEAAPAACSERQAAGRPALVYADAYFLPWLPYFGTVHMEHTFLVTGLAADGRTFAVADAYHNPTEWGLAEPVRSHLYRFGLVRAVAEPRAEHAGWIVDLEPAGAPCPPEPAGLLVGNARAVAEATSAGAIAAHAERYAQRLDDPAAMGELTLTCWLVHRRRALHARWLARVEAGQPALLPAGFAAAFEDEVVDAWRQARDFSYVAQRRAALGRRAPRTALDLLATGAEPAEAAAARRLLAHLEPSVPQAAAGGRA